MAPPWTAAETHTLLLAWREHIDAPSVGKNTIYKRFAALSGGTTARTKNSVMARRDTLRIMWAAITAFERAEKQHDVQRSWFALPEWEKRVKFVALMNGTTNAYTKVTHDTFVLLDAVMAMDTKQRSSSTAAAAVRAGPGSTHTTSVQSQGATSIDSTPAATLHNDTTSSSARGNPIVLHASVDDSGSSTESDDDFIAIRSIPSLRRAAESAAATHHSQPSPPLSPVPQPQPQRRRKELLHTHSARLSARGTQATVDSESDGSGGNSGWAPILTTARRKRAKLVSAAGAPAAGVGAAATDPTRARTQSTGAAEPSDERRRSTNKQARAPQSASEHQQQQQQTTATVPEPVEGQIDCVAPNASSWRRQLDKHIEPPYEHNADTLKSYAARTPALSIATLLSSQATAAANDDYGCDASPAAVSPSDDDDHDDSASITALKERLASPRKWSADADHSTSKASSTALAPLIAMASGTESARWWQEQRHQRGCEITVSELAAVLDAQAQTLRALCEQFQHLQQRDADAKRSFAALVDREERDQQHVVEEIRRLDASAERAQTEWARERAALQREHAERVWASSHWDGTARIHD